MIEVLMWIIIRIIISYNKDWKIKEVDVEKHMKLKYVSAAKSFFCISLEES